MSVISPIKQNDMYPDEHFQLMDGMNEMYPLCENPEQYNIQHLTSTPNRKMQASLFSPASSSVLIGTSESPFTGNQEDMFAAGLLTGIRNSPRRPGKALAAASTSTNGNMFGLTEARFDDTFEGLKSSNTPSRLLDTPGRLDVPSMAVNNQFSPSQFFGDALSSPLSTDSKKKHGQVSSPFTPGRSVSKLRPPRRLSMEVDQRNSETPNSDVNAEQTDVLKRRAKASLTDRFGSSPKSSSEDDTLSQEFSSSDSNNSPTQPRHLVHHSQNKFPNSPLGVRHSPRHSPRRRMLHTIGGSGLSLGGGGIGVSMEEQFSQINRRIQQR